jgi:ligand-binding SRPBCC domain-containing protein
MWEPMRRFVDAQRRGPYRRWIHLHEFEAVGDGRTRVIDHVRYAVPGGEIVQRLFVAPDLEKIWDYRARQLEELFAPQPVTP